MHYNSAYKKGFTLIELLLAIVLASMLIGVGVAGYRDFAIRQDVDAALRTLTADIREAQSKATSGTKPSSCTGTLDGYSLSFTVSPSTSAVTSYSINAVCNGTSTSVKTITPKATTRITLNRSTQPISFMFKSVSNGTDISASNPIIFTVASNNTLFANNVRTLTISSSGEIR